MNGHKRGLVGRRILPPHLSAYCYWSLPWLKCLRGRVPPCPYCVLEEPTSAGLGKASLTPSQ